MAIITGVMGFLRAWIHVPIALVIADHLPAERLTLWLLIHNIFILVFFILGFHQEMDCLCLWKELLYLLLDHLLDGLEITRRVILLHSIV